MKIWIEQNLLLPLFLFIGLMLIITLCLTGGFAASVQGLGSGAILLNLLWGILGVLGLTAGLGYVMGSRCPRCDKRLSLIKERDQRGQHMLRCQKCGYLEYK